jgi:hypothetical protein
MLLQLRVEEIKQQIKTIWTLGVDERGYLRKCECKNGGKKTMRETQVNRPNQKGQLGELGRNTRKQEVEEQRRLEIFL